jgi:hypothetical protein
MKQVCSCSCGKSTVIVCAAPISRFACHCLNCQSFTGLSVSDDCAFLSKSVVIPEVNSIEYSQINSFVSLQRGKCRFCSSPVVSKFNIFNILSFVYIPSKNIPHALVIPSIEAHTFYHRRISDISDSSPKYSGYWSSQLNTVRILLWSLPKGKNL